MISCPSFMPPLIQITIFARRLEAPEAVKSTAKKYWALKEDKMADEVDFSRKG